MNLDLLIKLAKLANNNPNENEANLAARKVCKMMAEANYKFVTKPSITINPITPEQHRAASKSWEGFKNVDPTIYYDWINEIYKAEKAKPGGGWKNPFNDIKNNSEKESRKMTCTKCGLEVETYRYKMNPFICNPCLWQAI